MQIEIQEALVHDQTTLPQLIELYLYDFSEFARWDVQDNGKFGYEAHILKGCWTESWRYSFLLRVDGKLAGFAIIDARSSLTGHTDVHDIAEFFVMRKYRRSGVGAYVAIKLFDRFPGKWEVRQMPSNTQATEFWRSIIRRYASNHFQELTWNNTYHRGPVQFFDTGGRTSEPKH